MSIFSRKYSIFQHVFQVFTKYDNWNSGPRTFTFNDSVKAININKKWLTNSEDGMMVPIGKIRWLAHSPIKFEMKVVSEKLDEIAKDVNVESGVEDSEPEHEKVESGVEDSETEEK